jgi:hypothetical protein
MAVCSGGLFLFVLVLGLRLLGQWGLERFLLFSQPQPSLRHVENDSTIPFKGDFARKV